MDTLAEIHMGRVGLDQRPLALLIVTQRPPTYQLPSVLLIFFMSLLLSSVGNCLFRRYIRTYLNILYVRHCLHDCVTLLDTE